METGKPDWTTLSLFWENLQSNCKGLEPQIDADSSDSADFLSVKSVIIRINQRFRPFIGKTTMRKYSSYGPVDKDLHFYVPRDAVIQKAYTHIVGENPEKGGHYITVWAPRQCGKTWAMNQVFYRLMKDERFRVLSLSVEYLKMQTDPLRIVQSLAEKIIKDLKLKNISVRTPDEFHTLFLKEE